METLETTDRTRPCPNCQLQLNVKIIRAKNKRSIFSCPDCRILLAIRTGDSSTAIQDGDWHFVGLKRKANSRSGCMFAQRKNK